MNRKVFFGCGGGAAFCAAAVVALVFFWAPRLFQKGKGWVATQMAEAQRISAFEQSWQPPSNAPDAEWFRPRSVRGSAGASASSRLCPS
jgi:hypothetical protein